jgi:phage tail sheath protein FI
MSQINESAIKTPGVYVTEIPSFPPSIAQVATAIPVFVGYTEFATVNGKDATMQAVEINSLVQYTRYFGEEPASQAVTVTLDGSNNPTGVDITPPYQLYNAIRLFFAHGGGTCFILSVGPYKSTGDGLITDFLPAGSATVFDIIQKVEDITLIVIPDAVILQPFDFNNLMTQSLQLCATMEDRFTIMDVYHGYLDRTFDNADVITVFRNAVGGSNLNYAAAYYPWLNTSLPASFGFTNINLNNGAPIALGAIVTGNVAISQITNAAQDLSTLVTPFLTAPNYYTVAPFNAAPYVSGGVGLPPASAYALIPAPTGGADVGHRLDFIDMVLTAFIGLRTFFTDKPTAYSGSIPAGSTVQEVHASFIQPGSAGSLSPIEQIMQTLLQINSLYPGGAPNATVTVAHYQGLTPSYLPGYAIPPNPGLYGGTTDPAAATFIQPALQNVFNTLMTMIESFSAAVANRVNSLEIQVVSTSTVYANIKNAIANAGVLVPPSGAIAGIYAAVDASRGVWKAPANVPLQFVIKPAVNIDAKMQEDLNIDTNAGKSVNAIRTFTGWGTLVWGARTLDGNSNDWRYIPVRRLFIMVEASVKNAAFSFVFEPNDSRTWTRVRAMIENYLTLLWKQGALAGSKPEQAFYVKVGLGQTMTFDDILNGRMIVEIGMAPVRPAEFIILRFTQIQQQS